jgi:transcriptional regulator with XRE-family HTH domain
MYRDVVLMTVAEVIGANAKKLRRDAGKSLEDVAKEACLHGLPWTTGRAGDFESGRAAPSFTTMYAVAAAIGSVIGRPVALAELLAGDQSVKLNDDLICELADLRAAVSGQPVTPGVSSATGIVVVKVGKPLSRKERVRRDFAESDLKMCRRLGVEPDAGAAAMARLWGHTFRTERDRRAGPDANAQRRGQISRQLKDELQQALQQEVST